MAKYLIILVILFTIWIISCNLNNYSLQIPEHPSKQQMTLPPHVKIEHLTKIQYQSRKFILHGIVIKKNDQFSLNAYGDFNLPIFSVFYLNQKISSTIHLKRLNNSNFKANYVGYDIWRIYFAQTNKDLQKFKHHHKDYSEEKIILIYDKKNYLKYKYFYITNRLIYRITFKDYRMYNHLLLPEKTICEHLGMNYKLNIVTLDAKVLPSGNITWSH